MTFKLPMLVLLLSIAASCAHAERPAIPEENDLVVFAVVATTDIHGRLLPQSATIRHADGTTHSVEVGGIDLLAAYLDALRRKYENRIVLVDCGDIFQGTMLSNEFEGAPMMRALGRLGYLAAAVGNHEFDFGQTGPIREAKPGGDPFGALKQRYATSPFPALAANIVERSTGRVLGWPGFQPYRVVRVGPLRIGLVGASSPATPDITIADVGINLEFLPIAKTLAEIASTLKGKEAVDFTVGILHVGGACDNTDDPDDLSSCDPDEELFQVAKALPAGTFDVLLGGHTHRLVAHRMGTTTLLQAGANLSHVGVVEVTWSTSQRKVVHIQPHLIPLCPWNWKSGESCLSPGSGPQIHPTALGEPVGLKPVLSDLLEQGEKELLTRASAETGSTVVQEFERTGVDSPEGLLVAAILLELRPQAGIALLNRSGIRTYFHAGSILMEDVYQMLPFDNTIATIRLNGSTLLDLLMVATSGAHDLPIVRGLRLKVDLNRDKCVAKDKDGDGVHERWERERLVSATLEDGTPIVPDQEYVIVTNSYLSDGGSDFGNVLASLPKGNIVQDKDFTLLRDAVGGWLRARRVELGTPGDAWTKHRKGPLVETVSLEEQPVDCR